MKPRKFNTPRPLSTHPAALLKKTAPRAEFEAAARILLNSYTAEYAGKKTVTGKRV